MVESHACSGSARRSISNTFASHGKMVVIDAFTFNINATNAMRRKDRDEWSEFMFLCVCLLSEILVACHEKEILNVLLYCFLSRIGLAEIKISPKVQFHIRLGSGPLVRCFGVVFVDGSSLAAYSSTAPRRQLLVDGSSLAARFWGSRKGSSWIWREKSVLDPFVK